MRSDESEEGLKPEKFDSDLKLTDVSFFYPSRSSVRVSASCHLLITTCIYISNLSFSTGAG